MRLRTGSQTPPLARVCVRAPMRVCMCFEKQDKRSPVLGYSSDMSSSYGAITRLGDDRLPRPLCLYMCSGARCQHDGTWRGRCGAGFLPPGGSSAPHPTQQAGERLMVESPELHPGLTWHLVFPPLHPHPWLGCPRARVSHPRLSQEHPLPHPLCLLTCSL